jgi:hypothetical protein
MQKQYRDRKRINFLNKPPLFPFPSLLRFSDYERSISIGALRAK